MKKLILMSALSLFILATSCSDGHKHQTWAPKTGKAMKKGKNNK